MKFCMHIGFSSRFVSGASYERVRYANFATSQKGQTPLFADDWAQFVI